MLPGGIYYDFVDFESMFSKIKIEPVIINDLPIESQEQAEALNNLLYTRIEGDFLSNIPTCSCGATRGTDALNYTCGECLTKVEESISSSLEPVLWVRVPEGVRGFILPIFQLILGRRFNTTQFNLIEYLINVDYNPRGRNKRTLTFLEENNIKRGLNFFIENFDDILEKLLSYRGISKSRNEDGYLLELVRRNRHKLFPKVLPLINKSIMIFEDEHQGNFVDPMVPKIVNAAKMLAGIDLNENFSLRQKENRAAKVCCIISDNGSELLDKGLLSGKPGILRQNLIATRSFFSGRTVISSITKPHHYAELHVPWSMAVQLFSFHLVNLLVKRGMSIIKAKTYVIEHKKKYCDLIYECLNELIENSPNGPHKYFDVHQDKEIILKGFSALDGRNPSLKLNSLMLKYITKVKTDLDDITLGIPITCIRPANADFDGDTMFNTLVIDGDSRERLRNFDFSSSVFDLDAPLKISRALTFTKEFTSTVGNWLTSKPDLPSNEDIRLMKQKLQG